MKTLEDLQLHFEEKLMHFVSENRRINQHLQHTCYGGYATLNGINQGYNWLLRRSEGYAEKYGFEDLEVRQYMKRAYDTVFKRLY